MLDFLNQNAAASQAIGSVGAIFVAIGVAWLQTCVSRRDQAAAQRSAARVLAMELLPTVKAIQAEAARVLQAWNGPNHLNVHAWQRMRIGEQPDILERALPRLAVFNEDTIGPVLGMLSAVREYHHLQSLTDLGQLPEAYI
jgi:hypothetical protein